MASGSPVVAGNKIYVLGSGTPNPAAYTYDYTVTTQATISGNTTNGFIQYINDPLTPTYKAPPDTTGGMPTIRVSGNAAFQAWDSGASYFSFSGLYFVANAAGASVMNSVTNVTVFGCVYDAFGATGFCYFVNGMSQFTMFGCEFFSSAGGSGAAIAITGNGPCLIDSCNFHDYPATALSIGSGVVKNCIISKCQGDGIDATSGNSSGTIEIIGNTIDGNTGHGISITQSTLTYLNAYNNIISNQTGVGQFGITISAGTTAVNNALKQFIDYNVFYNNTSNYNAISAGAHDTALGVTPYVGSSTEDYTLA
jgi:hypothetical protein